MATQAGFVENGGSVAAGFFARQCQNCFYMFHESDMRTVGCFHLGFCFMCYQKFELDYLIDGAPPAPRLPSPAPLSPMYEDHELGWSFESIFENGGGVAASCFVRQCQNCFYMFHETDMRTVGYVVFIWGFVFCVIKNLSWIISLMGHPRHLGSLRRHLCPLCTKILNLGGPLNLLVMLQVTPRGRPPLI
ncbi:unnamed protein product [Cuscuta epithymum]|uniref:RING-type domain-containing protein n=1 Tax=Cuscuta epithymum TaxID=186058 RepID=A0AAV0DFG0_9ASTE|nr:unnamed protein product [Cuscuta epithymum]